MPRLSVGDTAPDFTLSNQDGKSVTLSEFKDSGLSSTSTLLP